MKTVDHGEFVIKGIADLGNESQSLLQEIQEAAKQDKNIYIQEYQDFLNSKMAADILIYFKELQMNELKVKQKQGIERVLRLKNEGKASYGRPAKELPENFKERVLSMIEEHRPLAEYAKSLGMPTSTFYKYASSICKEAKNMMKNEKAG